MGEMEEEKEEIVSLECDYLIIGSGAASLAFIDTIIKQMNNNLKIILVDKKSTPGGHWVDAYDYCCLHQPSIVYGIESKQLEGNWLKLLTSKFTLPWNHRAFKKEILHYYLQFVNEKIKSKQLQYYPNCEYKFSNSNTNNNNNKVHTFFSNDKKMKYNVKVNIKLVNGVLGECQIPSLCPPNFHYDDKINMITPNELYELHHEEKKKE